MSTVLWLVLAFVFLAGVLLATIVIVFRRADPQEPTATVEQAADRMQALAVQIKNTKDSAAILALTKDLHQTAIELRRIVRGGSSKRGPREPSAAAREIIEQLDRDEDG